MTMTATVSMRRPRGRPVLGAISGFLFGIFLWIDLILFGVLPLESGVGYALPVLGLAGGIALGLWAPLGRSGPAATTTGPSTGPPGSPLPGPTAGTDMPPPGGDQPSAPTTSDGA